MEISAYLCSRNPLHAAGGARPMHGPHPTPTAATSRPHGWGQAGELHQRGRREAEAGPSARPYGAGCSPQKTALPGGAAQTQKLNVIKTDTNMTTLNLNAYGVTEMSHAEKVENNGGYWQIIAAIVSAALYCYDNWDDMGPATENGYAAGDSIYKP